MKIRKIDIQNIDGFKIGNAENIDKGTGCTVIVCEDGALAGVDVKGGAPATRETDLLKSENTVDSVNAVVLSGGSAFGLEASCGVMKELSDRGVGYDTSHTKVPIVCAASLYDLSVGDSNTYPDIEMGINATRNAYEGIFDHGNRGAGTGASVGKYLGMGRAMKSGLGVFACADDYLQVGAVVAVNAMGDIYNGAGNILAGLRSEDGKSIYGSIKSLKSMIHDNVESDAPEEIDYDNINDDSLQNDKTRNKDDIANAIKNAFNNKIKNESKSSDDMMVTGHFPKITEEIIEDADESQEDALQNEIKTESETQNEPGRRGRRGRRSYDNDAGFDEYLNIPSRLSKSGRTPGPDNKPSNEDDKQANIKSDKMEKTPSAAPKPEVPDSDETNDNDMGYDVTFNTTISCMITNAKLSKAQLNKLASILHDAYARAIKPVHGSMDGDTVFVLSTGRQEVNFDAFAALATDVLQYAIIDAGQSAKSAYGLPAACDIIKQ